MKSASEEALLDPTLCQVFNVNTFHKESTNTLSQLWISCNLKIRNKIGLSGGSYFHHWALPKILTFFFHFWKSFIFKGRYSATWVNNTENYTVIRKCNHLVTETKKKWMHSISVWYKKNHLTITPKSASLEALFRS